MSDTIYISVNPFEGATKKKTFLNSRTLDRIVVMFQLLLSDPAFMHSFASLSTMMVYYASPDFSGSIKIPM